MPPLPPNLPSLSLDVVVHDEGSCSACLSTLLVFLQSYHSQLCEYHPPQDGKIHIGIGKYIDDVPQGIILIGNCTSKAKKEGLFVQGCPPVASEIWNTLEHSKRDF